MVLAHPLKTRAIAEARIKTDTIDATTLAELLRLDEIAKAYIPPREVRDMRELLRYRASVVSLRMGLKNKVHAVLTKNGIESSLAMCLGKNLGSGSKRFRFETAIDESWTGTSV